MFCQDFWYLHSSKQAMTNIHHRLTQAKIKLFMFIMRNDNFKPLPPSYNSSVLQFQQSTNPEHLHFNLIWTFEIYQNGTCRVQVAPSYLEDHGVMLRADHHFLYSDFLQLIIAENASLDDWIIILGQDRELNLRLTSVDMSLFIDAFYRLREQVKSIFIKINKILQAFTLEPLPKDHSTVKRPSFPKRRTQIHEDIGKLTMMIQISCLMNQWSSSTRKPSKTFDFEGIKSQQYRFISKLNKQQEGGQQRYSKIMRVLGAREEVLVIKERTGPFKCQDQLSIRDQHDSDMEVDQRKRNLYGIRILSEIQKAEPIFQDRVNQLLLKAKYEVLFLKSLHATTNVAIESSQALYGYDPDDFKKKLDLAIKKLDKRSLAGKNYHQNQVNFLLYFKKIKGSNYIPTYYIEEKQMLEDENYEVIMMDYHQYTLKEFIEKKQPPIWKRIFILRRVLQGMIWLSSKGICHRQISTTNIILDDNCNPKIIDLGSSCSELSFQELTGSFKAVHKQLLKDNLCQGDFFRYMSSGKNRLTQKEYEQHHNFDLKGFAVVIEEVLGGVLSSFSLIGRFLHYMCERCQGLVMEERPSMEQLLNILDWLRHSYMKSH